MRNACNTIVTPLRVSLTLMSSCRLTLIVTKFKYRGSLCRTFLHPSKFRRACDSYRVWAFMIFFRSKFGTPNCENIVCETHFSKRLSVCRPCLYTRLKYRAGGHWFDIRLMLGLNA